MMGHLLTEDGVLQENQPIIKTWCNKYGKGLDLEDRLLVAYAAFLEAMRTWQKGHARFHVYAEEKVRVQLEAERRIKNDIIKIESPFSLDQPIRDDDESQGTFLTFARAKGDFVNSLMFRDFLAGLPINLGRTASRLIQEYQPEEILEIDNLTQDEFANHLLLLRQNWEAYHAELDLVA